MRSVIRISAKFLGWPILLLGASSGCSGLQTPTVPQNVAYVSNENGGVSVIDLASLQRIGQIHVSGNGPRGMALTPDGRYLLTANKETADVSVIDTQASREIRRIPIGTNPEFIKLHPAGRWIFTSHEPASTGGPPEQRSEEEKERVLSGPPSRIVALDTQDWAIAKVFRGGVETEGIEFSADGKRLIVTNEAEDTVAVYDVQTGELLRTVETRSYGYRPRGIKVSPDGRTYAVTLEASGTLLLLDEEFNVFHCISIGSRPYGVSFDRAGRRLFVAAAEAQVLQVFAADSLEVIAEVPVGRRCWHFTFTPDDSKILVACGRSNDVHVIDARTYQLIEVLEGFDLPWGIITYPRAHGSLDLP
ncbi:MAG: beta-propeller fold lactonase family protein [Acidobacteriota bacterium]